MLSQFTKKFPDGTSGKNSAKTKTHRKKDLEK
jgi:hypothetical protein